MRTTCNLLSLRQHSPLTRLWQLSQQKVIQSLAETPKEAISERLTPSLLRRTRETRTQDISRSDQRRGHPCLLVKAMKQASASLTRSRKRESLVSTHQEALIKSIVTALSSINKNKVISFCPLSLCKAETYRSQSKLRAATFSKRRETVYQVALKVAPTGCKC